MRLITHPIGIARYFRRALSELTHLSPGFLLVKFLHLVLVNIGGVIVIDEVKPGPSAHVRNIVRLVDPGLEMLGNVTSGLELLWTQRTLVRPLLLRSVAQEMLPDGSLSGQHLSTTLWTRHHGLVVVIATDVDSERLEVVKLSSTHLTLMNVHFWLA